MKEAYLLPLGCRDCPPCEEEFRSAALSEQKNQSSAASPTGRQAHLDLGEMEPGGWDREAQIAGGKNFQTTADRVSIYRRDDRAG